MLYSSDPGPRLEWAQRSAAAADGAARRLRPGGQATAVTARNTEQPRLVRQRPIAVLGRLFTRLPAARGEAKTAPIHLWGYRSYSGSSTSEMSTSGWSSTESQPDGENLNRVPLPSKTVRTPPALT